MASKRELEKTFQMVGRPETWPFYEKDTRCPKCGSSNWDVQWCRATRPWGPNRARTVYCMLDLTRSYWTNEHLHCVCENCQFYYVARPLDQRPVIAPPEPAPEPEAGPPEPGRELRPRRLD